MSRVASCVNQAALPGAVGVTAALDAVAEAYHNPAAVCWRVFAPSARMPPALSLRRAGSPWDGPLTQVHKWLAEVTPVRGDDEKQTAESERDARDDPSCGASLQPRDFGGDEPDTGEQDKQEPHFGDDHPSVRRETIG